MNFNYEDQKFFEGDLVRVAKDLDQGMRHFPCDQEAIVLGSHADQFPHRAEKRHAKMYNLYLLKDMKESSWYYEHQLEFIRANAYDALPEQHRLVQKRIAIKKRNAGVLV